MIQHTHQNLNYFTFKSFPTGSLVHAVFARTGGVSPQPYASLNMSISTGDSLENALSNRRLAFEAVALPFEQMMDVWQVHGTDVVCADSPRGDRDSVKADGLITNRRGLALFQRFADCVPIIFYDPKHQALGVAHAGWKGTILGAAASTVRAMTERFGTLPRDLIAGIGPSIGPDHYEVGAEVIEAVRQSFPKHDELLLPTQGRIHFNLWRANELALQELGVEQIEVAQICTACRNDLFFSHRAEKGQTGRFGAVIALRA